MWLLDRLVFEFVPNVVGSVVSAHIRGQNMNWGFRRHAFFPNHPTTSNVMCQPWDCFFNPQRIL